jgi:hypothetical protein
MDLPAPKEMEENLHQYAADEDVQIDAALPRKSYTFWFNPTAIDHWHDGQQNPVKPIPCQKFIADTNPSKKANQKHGIFPTASWRSDDRAMGRY